MWIPEKIYPTVFEKTCYLWTEITNKKISETPLWCWKYAMHTRYRGNNGLLLAAHRFQEEYLLYFKPQKRRAWHFVSRVLLYLFSFCSDFSCKYVITVNASNAYVTSKTVQNCSYCICWSIITNVMQRQVNCQCFSLGHFTFTQTPTV